jgi:hypothetical protein
MSIPQTLILSAILCVTVGCSSDEDSKEKAKNDDAGVLRGYKDSYDKAQGVEQTLLEAEKSRREALEKQQ